MIPSRTYSIFLKLLHENSRTYLALNNNKMNRKKSDSAPKVELDGELKEQIIDRIQDIEAEEQIKSEIQDDISGKFSLFLCCKQFKNPEKLFMHIKDHHDKDATKCELCGKELSSKSSLDRHLLIHAKWQPYKCTECNKLFSTNGNMHRHKKTHKAAFKSLNFQFDDDETKDSPFTKNSNRKTNLYSDTEDESEDSIVADRSKRKKRYQTCYSGNKGTVKKIKSDLGNSSRKEFFKKRVASRQLQIKMEESCENLNGNTNQSIDSFKLSLHKQEEKISIVSRTPDSNVSSPSKEEFITNLGLQVAVKYSEVNDKNCSIENLNKKVYLPCDNEKNVNIDSASSPLIIDCEKDNNDFADIKSIVSNVTVQPQARESEISFISEKDELRKNYWLPESPETSTEEKVFIKADELNREVPENHHQIKLFCKLCKKKFKNKIIFQKHMKKHNRTKPFKCLECDAKFLNKPNATRHVIKVHKKRRGSAKSLIANNLEVGGIKTVCEWCGQEFTNNLTLEHHKRAIIGCKAKPFVCLLCNKKFSTKNNGKRHLAQNHKEEATLDYIVQNNITMESEDVETSAIPMDSNSKGEILVENELQIDLKSDSKDSDILMKTNSSISRETRELDAVQSLLLMHSEGNSQEEPLDLSIHPMDLSTKLEENRKEKNILNNESLPVKNHLMVTLKNELLSQPVCKAQKRSSTQDVPLNLVRKRNLTGGHTFPLHSTPKNVLPSTSLEMKISPCSNINMHCEVKTKESNVPNVLNIDGVKFSPVQCDFCSISFANNSNKRRHEKKKHLAQETVEFLSSLRSRTTTEVSPVSNFSVNATKPMLSKKTKEALLTKMSYTKQDENILDFSVNRNNETNLLQSNNESESGDLASVSSLIITANSPQLKKYLTSDSNGDIAASPLDISVKSEIEADSSSNMSDNKPGTEKYKCSSCQKDFTCKSSFKRHSVIHTKERPYHCSLCQKTFTVKSNRDRHLKRIHNYSSEDLSVIPGKNVQAKSIPSIPSESSANGSTLKDSPSPNSDLSQCNKENQRLFMPS